MENEALLVELQGRLVALELVQIALLRGVPEERRDAVIADASDALRELAAGFAAIGADDGGVCDAARSALARLRSELRP